jgi:RNA-directed DNA polymerase
MVTKLTRIVELAKARPTERFTSLAHLIDVNHLKECHRQTSPRKAVGVDKVTKAEYDKALETNLQNLTTKLKRNAYKPQPVKRKYIPKPGSVQMRPLGILCYEDKLVQAALANILTSIYEPEFLNCSYGFRPGRGCHDALKELNYIIEEKNINYIVDADIRGFFDHVDQTWMMKFIAHRIADPQIQRLIARFLKAGVIEAGIKYDTPEGTPQGGVISPILANIYLHYALDLWFERGFKRNCRGKAYMIRYADDFICCFQNETDATEFLTMLKERMKKFNLELAEEKTRIIAFGRKAAQTGRNNGVKPGTFDFLGFTHYTGTSRKGTYRVKRKTSRKKFQASMHRCKEWLRENRNKPIMQLMEILRRKLQGHYNYYGITDNSNALCRFQYEVTRMIFKWLNRRSQRKSFEWDKFELFLNKYPLPEPRIKVNIYERRPNLKYAL